VIDTESGWAYQYPIITLNYTAVCGMNNIKDLCKDWRLAATGLCKAV